MKYTSYLVFSVLYMYVNLNKTFFWEETYFSELTYGSESLLQLVNIHKNKKTEAKISFEHVETESRKFVGIH